MAGGWPPNASSPEAAAGVRRRSPSRPYQDDDLSPLLGDRLRPQRLQRRDLRLENTSVLYCRIVDVGGCTWEGASRFVKFIGNYVRNAGTVAMGNLEPAIATQLSRCSAAGQHIVADNVFESNVPYGGCAIRSGPGRHPSDHPQQSLRELQLLGRRGVRLCRFHRLPLGQHHDHRQYLRHDLRGGEVGRREPPST